MVFYLKYRPQKIAELDLEEVRLRLQAILKAKELPHAFLFTGPKGLGKTSAARILAKAINCETNSKLKSQKSERKEHSNNEAIEPCNKCSACISITNGSNIDVLEIDAASNRGIDEIRELREKIKFSPSNLKRKVYIIDEVHMLTQDAFNALLKTLEEPPEHAVFVLCTTETEKVPPTIMSRTFQVSFKKPSKKEIMNSLERVIEGEKLVLEKSVLENIFLLSEGSFRDATKIIEELSIAASDNKITLALLDTLYRTGNLEKNIEELLFALSEKNAKESLGIVQKLVERGVDFRVVTEKMTNILHDMILARNGIEIDAVDIPGFSNKDLGEILDKLNDSYRDIKYSVLPQLPLEIVVVEWCYSSKNKPDMPAPKVEERMAPKKSNSDKDKDSEKNDKVATNEKPGHGMFEENVLPNNFFRALLDRVKQDNHSIAGILRGCRLVELNSNEIKFETAYKFHRDKLNESKIATILDKRSSEILKREIHVVVEKIDK